jgi:hypothetical protein
MGGGVRFGVGALGYLLKNRIYIGEVTYRGEHHRGEHAAIVERPVFEAVQKKLSGNAVDRQLRLRSSPAVLMGRIFDDRGNRMSPTHANKLGVRYRYYVSQALIQNRKTEAGNVTRVPAPEIEALILESVRQHLVSVDEPSACLADRDLIERHVARVVVKPQALEVHLAPPAGMLVQAEVPETDDEHLGQKPAFITLPRAAPSFVAVKGIVQAPSESLRLKVANRDALLFAISKPADGSKRSGSAARVPWPRSPETNLKESATSAC